MRKMKSILSLFLVLSILLVGTFSINISALADTISEVTKDETLNYITDKDKVKDNVTIRYKDADVISNAKSINPKDINSLASKKNINICVDDILASKDDIKGILINQLNTGSNVVIRKDDIKLEEIFNYFGINSTQEFKDSVNNQKSNLKTVAISVNKDSGGEYRTKIISVEDYTNEEKIQEAIAYALKLKVDVINEEKKVSIIQSNNVAYATALTWSGVATNTWIDYWNSVTVSYSLVLQKNPYNPSGGQYYYLAYSAIDVQPVGTYKYKDVYFMQYTSGGLVYAYGPTNKTNTSSYSYTLSLPPSISVSGSLGTTMCIEKTAGGIGNSYIQWDFYPYWLWTKSFTNNATHYELTSEYYKSSNYFTGSFSYSINMYTSGEVYAGTASVSDRTVSGY